ncbi:uncharacterized protein LOC107306499 [Coturnix japonica]|uniref:uncharacterized protein LOC107306499 n=1 Tax=Coturnix japonica TaxID=93934 RepID=UPI0013A5ED3D|nr:uncharacterized protein LOC107306499 [Coturnix japonica]XP_032297173.1 uncharacterized protein LOC107306499 [Coturnix japonica]
MRMEERREFVEICLWESLCASYRQDRGGDPPPPSEPQRYLNNADRAQGMTSKARHDRGQQHAGWNAPSPSQPGESEELPPKTHTHVRCSPLSCHHLAKSSLPCIREREPRPHVTFYRNGILFFIFIFIFIFWLPYTVLEIADGFPSSQMLRRLL